MNATTNGQSPATDATPRIDFDVFDAKCAERGALDEVARAELAQVDRVTLWRWRKGHQSPSFAAVHRIAQVFGITLEDLTRPPSAPKNEGN